MQRTASVSRFTPGSFTRALFTLVLFALAWVMTLLAGCVGDRPLMAPRTYYVSTNGSDINNGRSIHGPFRTLPRAISAANPGDTIEVRGGVYAGGLTINTPGTREGWITLKPYRNEKVTIDATGKSHGIYFYHPRFAPMYWTVEGLEIRGGEQYTVKIDTPNVKLIRNNLHGAKGDIVKLVSTANQILIDGNEIHHNAAPVGANAQGIDIVGSSDVKVVNNYVHDIPSIGMYAKGNAAEIVFERNRVENIAQRGIMLGQSTSREFLDRNKPYESYNSVIRHNTVRNTGSACLATASSFNVRIHHNTCYDTAKTNHGAIFVSNESELMQPGANLFIHDNTIVMGASTRPVVYIGPHALADERSGIKMERNRYWSATAPEAIHFAWERGERETAARFASVWSASLKDWQRLTGMEAASAVAAPDARPADSAHKLAHKTASADARAKVSAARLPQP